ncbi:MAG: hypothetical protein AAFR61_27070 [Bacteroidota bacterium]
MYRLLSLLLISGVFFTQARAQIGDKLIPHMGFVYEIATFSETGTNPQSDRTAFYTFNLGTYYSFFHKNDIVSVGIDPSVHFGFNVVGNGYINYMLQVPVFAMARVGANSTIYNQQKIGAGVGVGGIFTNLSEKISPDLRRSSRYINPAVVAEVTIMSRSGTLTVRGHYAIAEALADQIYKDNDGNITNRLERSFGGFGAGLIYGF